MSIRAEMHQDHREWSSEHAAWNDDLLAWSLEIERALASVSQLESMLREHHVQMLEHARAIRKQELATLTHEHTLAEQQRGALPMPCDVDVPTHRRERREENTLVDVHERMKKRHHAMMVRLAKLKELLDAPLPVG